jgi:hypothetical protein
VKHRVPENRTGLADSALPLSYVHRGMDDGIRTRDLFVISEVRRTLRIGHPMFSCLPLPRTR